MSAATPPPVLIQKPPQRSIELSSRDDICFLHPGYPGFNLLLKLPRVDRTIEVDATTPTYGVHHRTALLACQIIAGNAFYNSRFTLDRTGQQPVQVLLDSVLTHTQYYFIVDGFDPYPIVPSFQDWQFPHDNIPDFWPLATSNNIPDFWPSTSTATCGITNANFAIDQAHLIPQKEKVWYDDNGMSKYGTGLSDINNEANNLPLKKDIHHCFDNRWFVIVPKIVKVKDESAAPSIQYVTHIITREANELWPTYHNTLIGSLHDCSRPYLFARFAWTILLQVKLFVINGRPRHVIQIYEDEEGKTEYKAEHCTGKMLISKYGGGGSQAATSKKRKSGSNSMANDEGNTEESSDGDSDNSIDDKDGLWDMMNDWRERGEKRRRDSSDETAPVIKVNLAPDIEKDLREALYKGMLEQ